MVHVTKHALILFVSSFVLMNLRAADDKDKEDILIEYTQQGKELYAADIFYIFMPESSYRANNTALIHLVGSNTEKQEVNNPYYYDGAYVAYDDVHCSWNAGADNPCFFYMKLSANNETLAQTFSPRALLAESSSAQKPKDPSAVFVESIKNILTVNRRPDLFDHSLTIGGNGFHLKEFKVEWINGKAETNRYADRQFKVSFKYAQKEKN